MSASVTVGSTRVPWSWGSLWQRQRAMVIVVVMTGAGLGSSGVTAAGAAGASQRDPTPSAEAAAINADAGRLATQYRGNRQVLQEAGRAGLTAGRNDATVAEFLQLGWARRLSAALERHGAMLDSVHVRQVAFGSPAFAILPRTSTPACSEPGRAG